MVRAATARTGRHELNLVVIAHYGNHGLERLKHVDERSLPITMVVGADKDGSFDPAAYEAKGVLAAHICRDATFMKTMGTIIDLSWIAA